MRAVPSESPLIWPSVFERTLAVLVPAKELDLEHFDEPTPSVLEILGDYCRFSLVESRADHCSCISKQAWASSMHQAFQQVGSYESYIESYKEGMRNVATSMVKDSLGEEVSQEDIDAEVATMLGAPQFLHYFSNSYTWQYHIRDVLDCAQSLSVGYVRNLPGDPRCMTCLGTGVVPTTSPSVVRFDWMTFLSRIPPKTSLVTYLHWVSCFSPSNPDAVVTADGIWYVPSGEESEFMDEIIGFVKSEFGQEAQRMSVVEVSISPSDFDCGSWVYA